MRAVKDIDMGWDRLRELFDDQQLAGSGITLNVKATVPYAVYLEYGTARGVGWGPGVPRPFMRWTFDRHSNYKWQLRSLARELLSPRSKSTGRFITAKAKLEEFGQHVVSDVQKTIDAMGLIDTGALRASIVATVAKAGG